MPQKVVTLRRWQIVAAFVILTCAFVWMGVVLKDQINQVSHDKASIHSLEKSNCKTRDFLISSAKFRAQRIALDKTAAQKAKDKQAAKVSIKLANSFSNELCSAKVTLKGVEK